MLPQGRATEFWGIQCLPPTAKGSGGNGVTLNHRRSRWVIASLLPHFGTREGQVGGIKNPFCSSTRYHSLARHNPFNPPRLRNNASRGRTPGSESTASSIQAQNKERDGTWKGHGDTSRKIFLWGPATSVKGRAQRFYFTSAHWFDSFWVFTEVCQVILPVVPVNFWWISL